MRDLIVRIVLTILLIAPCLITRGQAANDYLPPTPTVAALGKYVDAPINLATGTPDITLPIYEIKAGSFSLPISLSYHAGGFRVEEDASWVGLGWSVMAGGVITRTIRGQIDNSSRDVFFNTYDGRDLNSDNEQDYKDLVRLADFHPDGMPDLYIYNFTGHSGKFINVNGVKLLPKKPIIIIPGLQSFEVIDEQGNKYIFSDIESAKTRSTTTATNEKISWYLSSITTPTGDEITFHYKSTQFFQVVNISESKSYKQLPTGRYELESQSENSFVTTLYGKELQSITWSQGAVEFISEYDRADISKPQGTVGALRLKGIKVVDKLGKINKMVYLSHDYFGPSDSTDPNKKRLKLLSVVEDINPIIDQAASGELKTYKFQYGTGIELPPKDSKSQDHWGYYNGKNNTSLVPPLYTGPGNVTDDCGTESDIDLQGTRDTDTTFVKACLLTKIIYPTGGYTTYDYESHDYGFANGSSIPIKNIRVNESNHSVLVSAYTNNPNYSPNTRSIHTETFEFAEAQCVKIWINILYPPMWEDGSQSQAKIELWMEGTGPEPDAFIELFKNTENGDNFIFLNPGRYKLKATGTMNGSTASAIAYYSNFNIVTIVKRYAGGVRVKRISENDAFGAPKVRRITYNVNSNSNLSSGHILEQPEYIKPFYTWQAPPNDDGGMGMFCVFNKTAHRNISSSSQLSLGSGNHIAYREVQVLYGENAENGKTVSIFTTSPNLTHGTESDVSWRRGLLVTSTDLDNTNFKLRSIQNEYSFVALQEYYGLTVEDIGSHPCATETNRGDYEVNFKQTVSILSSEFYTLTKTTTEEFSRQSNGSIKNSEQYLYDNVIHLQRTRTIKEVGDKRLVTHISYPDDYPDALGFIADLKLANIIAPIETVTWQETLNGFNTGVLHGQLNIYKTGGRGLLEEVRALEIFEPQSQSSFKFANRNFGIQPPEGIAVNFSPFPGYISKTTIAYDDNFNPVQVTSNNGNVTSYVWGYQNDFPIAKVSNAISSKIAYTGFENNNEGNWDSYISNLSNARTGNKGFIGILSKSDIPLDNYVITLWVKDGTGTPSIAGQSPITTSEPIRGWKLIRWEVSLSSQLTINTNGSLIDDVSFYPVNSLMSSLSYDPLKGAVSITDPNNVTTYYEYDAVGRLEMVKDSNQNIVKHYKYHYKGEQ